MRTILAWLLFSRSELEQIEDRPGDPVSALLRYPIPGYTMFFITMPVFFVVLFSLTHLWATKVEPYFGMITKAAEDLMFEKKQERATVLPVRQD